MQFFRGSSRAFSAATKPLNIQTPSGGGGGDKKKRKRKMPRRIPLRPPRTRPRQTTLKSQQSLPFPQRKRNSSHPRPADFQQTNKHKRGEKRWGRTARAGRCEGAPDTAGSQHGTPGIVWFPAGFLQAEKTLNVTSSEV